jgi:hypothetical protein
MLISVDTPEFNDYMIYDCDGHVIPYVISFDTDTEEIELSIGVCRKEKEESKFVLLMQSITFEGTATSTPILVKFKLPGAYALKNGEAIN